MSERRVILITGASGVIGLHLVRHFVANGDTVIAVALEPVSGEDVSSDTGRPVGKLFSLQIDLEKPGGIAGVMTYLDSIRMRPTGLVNAARSLAHLALDENNMPGPESWAGEFHLGVVIPYQLSMVLANQADSELRAVVSLSSMYGLVAPTPSLYDKFEEQSPVHYGVVKAALNHLSKELSVRLAPRGIRVNTVSPGGIVGRETREFRERYARLCPAGRMLRGEEVCGAVDFLLSNAASGVTGHNLVVDGGWTVW